MLACICGLAHAFVSFLPDLLCVQFCADAYSAVFGCTEPVELRSNVPFLSSHVLRADSLASLDAEGF